MKTKMDAVSAALKAGDYNAWVTAMKAINENFPALKKVTSANFADYVKNFQDRETKMADRQKKMDAIRSAVTAGDYNAWVTAVKAINEKNPDLSKINADNFSRYAEASKLRDQADSIFKELGVNGGGMMRGEGRGVMFGR